MRRKKILSLFLAVIFMMAVNPAMTGQSSYEDCSQKYLVNEPPPIGSGNSHYRRRIVFPWYTVGPTPDGRRWETRLIFGLAAVPPPKDFLGGNYFLTFKTMKEVPPGLGPGLEIENKSSGNPQNYTRGYTAGIFGNFLRLGSRAEMGMYSLAFGDWDHNIYPVNDVDVGVIVLDFYAGSQSNPCEVNKAWDFAYAQLTFVSRRPDGTVEWQVSEPGYFVDQLSSRWAAPINVSGIPSDPPDFRDFEDASFAVANGGNSEVRVRISVFDVLGAPWEPDVPRNPCLQRIIALKPLETKGYIIRNFFEENAPQCGGKNPLFNSFVGYDSGFGGRPSGFRGTILFEAVDVSGNVVPDGKIVPVVIQRVGDSLTNVQLVKLPPQKPTW